jgi:hypothetical protein
MEVPDLYYSQNRQLRMGGSRSTFARAYKYICNTSKLVLNSNKRNIVFINNKIKALYVSANDGHHQKAANTSKEMLCIC